MDERQQCCPSCGFVFSIAVEELADNPFAGPLRELDSDAADFSQVVFCSRCGNAFDFDPEGDTAPLT